MNKKDLLIRVLTKLQPYWDSADALLIVVENYDLPDSMLDIVLKPINAAVGRLANKKMQHALQQQLDTIKQIHVQEEQERIHDEDDANRLLD